VKTVPDQFVCAHPALAVTIHAPLMLQAVVGLEAATIAQAFLVSPSGMAQRLVRAKARIKSLGLQFEEPEARALPQRLAAVLEGIYAAYSIGTSAAADAPPAGLLAESVFLAQLVVKLQPASAEAWGLLALLLYCEARRPAQFDAQGGFVPLTRQDTGQWDHALLQEAERCLRRAAALRSPGPLQTEAAIQSAHCQRAFTGRTPWRAIAHLYGTLLAQAPTTGARIGQAVALAEAGDAPGGLTLLQAIETQEIAQHQSYWAAAAHLHAACGQARQGQAARARAIGLTMDPRVRAWLQAGVGPATATPCQPPLPPSSP